MVPSVLGSLSLVSTFSVVPRSQYNPLPIELQLTNRELGLATHYVPTESISDIIRQISEHPSPSTRNISDLIASYAPPSSSEVNSKSNPDGSTVITGEIRKFLDATFSKNSLTEVYRALEKGEKHESQEVKDWAAEQKAILDAKSPSGMAVALAAFKKAREAQRLDQTLLNDMAMATAFAVSPTK
jgi:3-hydroxyisobutyryl-CoA hydrolase